MNKKANKENLKIKEALRDCLKDNYFVVFLVVYHCDLTCHLTLPYHVKISFQLTAQQASIIKRWLFNTSVDMMTM